MPSDGDGVVSEVLSRPVMERATVVRVGDESYCFEWSVSAHARVVGSNDGIRSELMETYQPPNVWVWIRQMSGEP